MGGEHSHRGCFEPAVPRRIALLGLLFATELTIPAWAYAAPLEVYGRLPHLEQLEPSPDGSRLAFVRTEGDSRTVVIVPLGKQEVLGVLRAGDQKWPFAQSQMMYEALRKQNKEAPLVTLKNEDHWLSRSATRLQMLEESLAFLRKHNPPD